MKGWLEHILNKKRTWLVRLFLFLFVYSFYVLVSTGCLNGIIDSEAYRNITETFIEEGTIDITAYYGGGDYSEDGTTFYSKYSLTFPLVSLPFVYIGKLLDNDEQFIPYRYFFKHSFTRFFFSQVTPFFTALTVLLLFSFAVNLGYTVRKSVFLALIYGLTTHALSQAVDSLPDPISTFFVLLTIFGIVSYKLLKKKRYLVYFSVGIFLAVHTKFNAIFLFPFIIIFYLYSIFPKYIEDKISKYIFKSLLTKVLIGIIPLIVLWIVLIIDSRHTYGIILLAPKTLYILIFLSFIYLSILYLYIWIKNINIWLYIKQLITTKEFYIVILPMIVCIGSVMYYNYYRYDNIFNTGYIGVETFTGNVVQGLMVNLLTPGRSIFLYSPIIILSFFAFRRFYSEYKYIFFLFIAVIGTYLLTISMWYGWDGGWSYGPRYLLQTIPFFVLMLGHVFNNRTEKAKNYLKIFGVMLLLLGFYINFTGAIVNFMAYLTDNSEIAYSKAFFHIDKSQPYNNLQFLIENSYDRNSLWIYWVINRIDYNYFSNIDYKSMVNFHHILLVGISGIIVLMFSSCLILLFLIRKLNIRIIILNIIKKTKFIVKEVKIKKYVFLLRLILFLILFIFVLLYFTIQTSNTKYLVIEKHLSRSKNLISIEKYEEAINFLRCILKVDKTNTEAEKLFNLLAINGLNKTIYNDNLWEDVSDAKGFSLSIKRSLIPERNSFPGKKNNYSIKWEGFLFIPETGTYTFYLRSNDGAKLYLDNNMIINHPDNIISKEFYISEVELKQGYHPIKVKYRQLKLESYIYLCWKNPISGNIEIIPSKYLFRKNYNADQNEKYRQLSLKYRNEELYTLALKYYNKLCKQKRKNKYYDKYYINYLLKMSKKIDNIVGTKINFENKKKHNTYIKTGNAFMNNPVLYSKYKNYYIDNQEGKYFISTLNYNNNSDIGSLKTNRFTLFGNHIHIKIAGGKDINKLYVALISCDNDHTIIHRATGDYSLELKEIIWDISEYSGQKAYIEVRDNKIGEWGFIMVDDIYQTLD